MVDLLKAKTLPAALTSYDLLKALAIVLMVIDHIGYFFFPENMWWRIVGRLCVPIWFFLIGYAQTREIPKLFWIAGVVVVLSAVVSGEYVFPMTIIFALIFARMSVDWMFARATRNLEAFAGMFFLLFLMSGPTLVFVEYATLGFLFTLFGAFRRNKEIVTAPRWVLPAFVVASAVAYILVQSVLLPTLTLGQLLLFIVGMIVVCTLLYRFMPKVYEGLSVASFPPVAFVQFLGRRTLEIYVLHLIVLRGFVMVMQPERFEPLQFQIFASPQVQAFFF